MNAFLDPPPVVWPLCFLLVALIVIHLVREEVKPIMRAVVGGLTTDAGRNYKAYATAIAFGLSASLSAWVEAFKDLTAADAATLSYWQLSALFARVANPFLVAMLAYAYKPQGQTGETKPPFPQP